MLAPALVVAPLHWLGVSPLLVYNLTLLAAFVASGVAAYVLVRYLTGSTAAALLGGLVFAFAPYRMEHFDHLELQFAFWIPLAVLAWHRAAESDGPADHLKVGALTSAQILSSIYYGIFLVTWLGFMTVLWHIRAPRRAARAIVLSLALPLAVLAIYSVPYQNSHKAVGERPRAEVAEYSARPLDFLSAPANNWLYGRTSRWGANERHLFPGAVALALAVVGLWAPPTRAFASTEWGSPFRWCSRWASTPGSTHCSTTGCCPFGGCACRRARAFSSCWESRFWLAPDSRVS